MFSGIISKKFTEIWRKHIACTRAINRNDISPKDINPKEATFCALFFIFSGKKTSKWIKFPQPWATNSSDTQLGMKYGMAHIWVYHIPVFQPFDPQPLKSFGSGDMICQTQPTYTCGTEEVMKCWPYLLALLHSTRSNRVMQQRSSRGKKKERKKVLIMVNLQPNTLEFRAVNAPSTFIGGMNHQYTLKLKKSGGSFSHFNSTAGINWISQTDKTTEVRWDAKLPIDHSFEDVAIAAAITVQPYIYVYAYNCNVYIYICIKLQRIYIYIYTKKKFTPPEEYERTPNGIQNEVKYLSVSRCKT